MARRDIERLLTWALAVTLIGLCLLLVFEILARQGSGTDSPEEQAIEIVALVGSIIALAMTINKVGR